MASRTGSALLQGFGDALTSLSKRMFADIDYEKEEEREEERYQREIERKEAAAKLELEHRRKLEKLLAEDRMRQQLEFIGASSSNRVSLGVGDSPLKGAQQKVDQYKREAAAQDARHAATSGVDTQVATLNRAQETGLPAIEGAVGVERAGWEGRAAAARRNAIVESGAPLSAAEGGRASRQLKNIPSNVVKAFETNLFSVLAQYTDEEGVPYIDKLRATDANEEPPPPEWAALYREAMTRLNNHEDQQVIIDDIAQKAKRLAAPAPETAEQPSAAPGAARVNEAANSRQAASPRGAGMSSLLGQAAGAMMRGHVGGGSPSSSSAPSSSAKANVGNLLTRGYPGARSGNLLDQKPEPSEEDVTALITASPEQLNEAIRIFNKKYGDGEAEKILNGQ